MDLVVAVSHYCTFRLKNVTSNARQRNARLDCVQLKAPLQLTRERQFEYSMHYFFEDIQRSVVSTAAATTKCVRGPPLPSGLLARTHARAP
jgi:hypothetical protein